MKDMSEEKEWCEHIKHENGWWHFRDWNLNLVEYMKFCPICGKEKPMSNEKDDMSKASCACLKVIYQPIHNADNSCTERWVCESCGNEFVKKQQIKSLESRLKEANDCADFNMNTRIKAENEMFALEERLSQAEAENTKLRDALRPFANMSECIENDKDFHIDGDCWIKAKEVLRG
jgi:hypothetical protein